MLRHILTDQPNDLTLVELDTADAATNEEVRARATESSKSHDTTRYAVYENAVEVAFVPRSKSKYKIHDFV